MDIDAIDRTVVERQDPRVGSLLDSQYRVHERIAAGGFAAIYRATHVASKREFAIKILHANLVNDARVIARFRREGAALATLHDKHTINAYELGEAPDGTLYIVMELLTGDSLYERFRARGPLGWQVMVGIARSICSSLAEAHSLGIIHRDLKPANIHLERRGDDRDFVKVLDFGIVRISDNADIDSTELTQAGQVIGTFDYMSPEQMIGGAVDGRSDIYALGVLMYEMISGLRPYAEANTLTSLLAAVLTGSPPPLALRIVVPAALDRIVMRCLEREPQSRFSDVAELAAALEGLTSTDEGVTRRISLSQIPEIASSDDVTRIVRGGEQRRRPTPPPPQAPVPVRVRASSPALSPPPMPERRSSSTLPPSQHQAERPSMPQVQRGSAPVVTQPHRGSAPVVSQPQRSSAPVVASQRPSEPIVPQRPVMNLSPHQPGPPGEPPVRPSQWNLAPGNPLPTPIPVAAQARGSSLDFRPYDMVEARNRDLMMRRIVLALSIALVALLAFVIAHR